MRVAFTPPMPLATPGLPVAGNSRAPESASYLVSSFELRAGLEVAVLAVSQLPADTVRELVRLHRCWAGDTAPQALSRA